MLRRIVGPKRRPDDWSTPHERALVRLSDRMDGLLEADEAAWLDTHLADCADCRAAATAYGENRAMLQGLPLPEPPRDLHSRTMAAIEAEDRRYRRGAAGGAGVNARRLAPYGALASVLIVALVVGATAFAPVTVQDAVQPTPHAAASSGPSGGPSVASSLPPGTTSTPPAPTPIVVPAASPVGWASVADDGSYAVNVARVAEVCAPEASPDCASIDAAASAVVTIETVPAAVVGAPGGGQLVVADAGTRQTGGSLFALALPTAAPSTAPSSEPSPSQSPEPTASVLTEPTQSPSTEPTTSPSAEATASPSVAVTASPSLEPSPSAEARRLAILDDIVLVGESAAYSPSGTWFAFTARPPDGSQGPDVYVWRPDWPSARPLTDDHRSVFGSWLGERLVVSRPVPPTLPVDAAASPPPSAVSEAASRFSATTDLVDPETGTTTDLRAEAMWRPSIDPSGRFVVYWDGTVESDPATLEWRPAEGRLVIARFDATADPIVSDPVALVEGPMTDWDARWDEHGGRLALWVADPEVPGIGELSAYVVDPSTGLDRGDPILIDVLALPGFTIGHGRLAWATPPGQGGEGSTLEVLAWVGPDKGVVKGDPSQGDAPVIVVR